jgi:hypothetical protein
MRAIDAGAHTRNTRTLAWRRSPATWKTNLDWITNDIAIGNCDDAVRLIELRHAGIDAILSLTGWPNNAANPHGIAWRCVELIDGEGNEVHRLHEALCHLHELLDAGSVLVHCMEGVSRSALVVASYLADKTNRSFEECLQEVARARRGVYLQPGLIDLRRTYEIAFEPPQRLARFAAGNEAAATLPPGS